jgi:predicted DNA-binding protein (UPF0251 family)
MGVSRGTVQRLPGSARKKLVLALFESAALIHKEEGDRRDV